LYEFYFYVKYNKRKNRSIRECIEKHKNCEKCTHISNPNKFFSFNITSQLITILEKIGCENVIYFDEKNCCDEMSKKILYCISYMSKEYHSKSALWYRNFLCRKNNINQKSSVNKLNIDELDKRFYHTYLSDIVCDDKITMDDFINEKNKKIEIL